MSQLTRRTKHISHCCSVAQLDLFVMPRTAAGQPSLSYTNSQSLLKVMSIKLMMPSNPLILSCKILCTNSCTNTIFFLLSLLYSCAFKIIAVVWGEKIGMVYFSQHFICRFLISDTEIIVNMYIYLKGRVEAPGDYFFFSSKNELMKQNF